MYRPDKDWDKRTLDEYLILTGWKPANMRGALSLVEHVADAMLEALRKDGIRASNIRDLKYPECDTITIPTLERMKEMKETWGTWVFIPGEEDK